MIAGHLLGVVSYDQKTASFFGGVIGLDLAGV